MIKVSSDIKFLSSNTKTRRLGYFKLLAKFMDERKKVPESIIYRKFEEYCSDAENLLLAHANTKGIITRTKSGNSAKPYIDLATSLSLIYKRNEMFFADKSLKVFNILKKENNDYSINLFTLTKIDKLFFLERVLNEDFIYVFLILEVIILKKTSDFKGFKLIYHQELLNKLDELLLRTDINKNSILKEAKERIKKWEKPEVYLEHVLMPRLNWLYDFELLNLTKKLEVELTKAGVKLYDILSNALESSLDLVIDSEKFFNLNYIQTFKEIYNLDTKDVGIETKVSLIETYISKSLIHFQTLAPNRVTYSQAISYVKYNLIINEKVITENSEIKNFFDEKYIKNYYYKYQHQFKDGYIQKRN